MACMAEHDGADSLPEPAHPNFPIQDATQPWPPQAATGRTTITVQRDTAMDFRAVRVEMSRAGGAMMSADDVLAILIHYWRGKHGNEEGR
jgi:hypothetical protein